MTTIRIITVGHRRVSLPDLRRQLVRELQQLATWCRTIRRTIRTMVHLPRRCTVTAIWCVHCRCWTTPARFSMRYMACPPCTRTLATQARTRLHTQRANPPTRP